MKKYAMAYVTSWDGEIQMSIIEAANEIGAYMHIYEEYFAPVNYLDLGELENDEEAIVRIKLSAIHLDGAIGGICME